VQRKGGGITEKGRKREETAERMEGRRDYREGSRREESDESDGREESDESNGREEGFQRREGGGKRLLIETEGRRDYREGKEEGRE